MRKNKDMRLHTAAFGVIALFLGCEVSMASTQSLLGCSSDKDRHVSFVVEEGSQMNLDVSPDGKLIAFDLLGDIYTVSVSGGKARRITNGKAWDKRPVWSPNGDTLGFISDRLGHDDVFTVQLANPDVTPVPIEKRLHSKGGGISYYEGRIRYAEWLNPDQMVVDSKIYSTKQATQLGAMAEKSPGEAYFGTGDVVYYFTPVSKTSPLARKSGESIGGYDVWRIARGVTSKIPDVNLKLAMGGEGPAASRKGRWFVYRDRSPISAANRLANHDVPSSEEEETDTDTIRVFDTRTGADRVLIGPGVSEGWRSNGVNRNRIGISTNIRFDISPDSESLYISYGGNIHKVDISTGTNTTIPLSAQVEQCLEPMAKSVRAPASNRTHSRNIRDATSSNDGTELLFASGRRLYTMDIGSGRARILLNQVEGQFNPSYSPDGKWIAFVTWDDAKGGHLWKARKNGTAAQRLTSEAGYYQAPTWSPDGNSIAFIGSGDLIKDRSGFSAHVSQGELRMLNVRSGLIKSLGRMVRSGTKLTFSADASRIYYSPYIRDYGDPLQLFSVAADGSDQHDEHVERFFDIRGVASATVHPSRSTIAAIKAGNLYLIDCPLSERGLDAYTSEGCREVRLTATGGNDPVWRENGEILEWSFADSYYRVRLSDILAMSTAASKQDLSGSLQNSAVVRVVKTNLTISRREASGSLLLQGAKIITMRGDEVFEKGNILVRDNRIAFIGEALPGLPGGTTVIDVTGKTIIPGLIDAHGHLSELPRDILPKNHWRTLVTLALGTTTVKDPSNGGDQGFAYAELIDSGEMIGPRIFGTTAMVSDLIEPLQSYGEARNRAQRLQRLGASFVKYHSGFDRRQRNWIIQSGLSLGMSAAAHMPLETLETSQLNLSTIIDGTTSSEHELTDTNNLYDDVSSFIHQSGVYLCFSPLGANGGYAERYWRSLSQDPRLVNFYRGEAPLLQLAPVGLSGSLAPLRPAAEENAKFLADFSKDSEQVLIGSHGDYLGVGIHMEMWAHVKGGMSNHKVLRGATLNVARSLNLDADLGSLEVGKLADLLILDRDPLEDIRNTLSVARVMKDGVLRDSYTLDEIWPKVTPLPKWEMPGRPAFIGVPKSTEKIIH